MILTTVYLYQMHSKLICFIFWLSFVHHWYQSRKGQPEFNLDRVLPQLTLKFLLMLPVQIVQQIIRTFIFHNLFEICACMVISSNKIDLCMQLRIRRLCKKDSWWPFWRIWASQVLSKSTLECWRRKSSRTCQRICHIKDWNWQNHIRTQLWWSWCYKASKNWFQIFICSQHKQCSYNFC